MIVIRAERLELRQLELDDAEFILELLNEAAFLRFIGDKGVRTAADAREYILKGPMDSYARHGFGLYAACLLDGTPIGICGLVKREGLADVDVGFAFLARYRSNGYAVESASAVLAHARRVLQLQRIVAIASPDNLGSIAVLGKIGLKFERMIRLSEHGSELKLFAPMPHRCFNGAPGAGTGSCPPGAADDMRRTDALDSGGLSTISRSLPMHPFPHRYVVNAAVRPVGDVPLSTDGVRIIESAPPKEFDGPGNQWSPEGLLTAAVADCFVLGFRAIAAASKYPWVSLESRTEGTLDRIDGKMRFTRFDTHAKLLVPEGTDVERAKKLLEKAEQICLVANSLSSERHLTVEVNTSAQ